MNLIDQSIYHLEQGLELLHNLDRQGLSPTDVSEPGTGVGPHFRHVIDFYRCFLRGLETGKVDYDARQRDPELEKEPRRTIQAIEELITQLATLSDADRGRTVEVKGDGGGVEALWNHSSIGRELHFLMSHTVHHYALIAILLRARGHEPGETFGVAPSTLEYRRLTSCAQ